MTDKALILWLRSMAEVEKLALHTDILQEAANRIEALTHARNGATSPTVGPQRAAPKSVAAVEAEVKQVGNKLGPISGWGMPW